MSRLDELIQELCPDSVEYKTLGEIAVDIYRGAGITRDQVTAEGTPCVRYGEIYTTYGVWFDKCVSHTDESKLLSKKYFEHGDILFAITGESVDDIAKCCVYIGHEKCLAGGDIVVLKHNQNPKYLSYALATTDARQQKSKGKVKSKVVHSSVPAIREIKVPVPPIEVQCEIVRILDNFTNLTAELTAELTARKKQYDFYRDRLLERKTTKVNFCTVENICEISRGKVISKDFIKENYGEYPVYSSQTENNGVLGWISTFDYDGEYLTWTTDGANAGTVFYRKGRFNITNVCGLLKPKNSEINIRYLYFALKLVAKKYVVQGMGNPKLMSNVMGKIKIPVPPLDVQNRIADVLDNFEKICSDLNIGLPAEIEARQKQYEYYRDKLLTFAETGNTILSRAEQSRAEQSRAEQSRAEQSRAEQSRAEQSRAEQSRALIKLLQYVFGYAVVTLEDIAENCDSMRKPVTSGKREAGEYPYYGASGIVDYVKDYIFDGDYLLVSEDGANLLARSTPIAFSISGKNWVNNHAHVLKFDRYETRRFVEFYLNSIDLAPYISGGAQPKLNQKNLNRIEIPLPSQERQKYIVDILDRFDAICNDLTSGLPAEIEARQKQYEYYRDRLLSFKELN